MSKHCIQIKPGGSDCPPCAGDWIRDGDALYPADAATAKAAGLSFPRPAPAPEQIPAVEPQPNPKK